VKPQIPHLWTRRFPWSILVIAGVLVVLGWVGLGRHADLTGGGNRFLQQQIMWSLVAVGAALAAVLPNYRVLSRWTYGLLIAALCLLALVYLFPPINGVRRWIRLGPVGLQPSELPSSPSSWRWPGIWPIESRIAGLWACCCRWP